MQRHPLLFYTNVEPSKKTEYLLAKRSMQHLCTSILPYKICKNKYQYKNSDFWPYKCAFHVAIKMRLPYNALAIKGVLCGITFPREAQRFSKPT